MKDEVLKKGFEAQAKAMQDYGYPDVTAETIREHHDLWMKGEKDKGIIWMFSEGAFEKNPKIFGKPA